MRRPGAPANADVRALCPRVAAGFQYSTLNTSRWKSISSVSLDHCPTPGAVGAANAATCTAMLPSQIQLGVPLPGYPTSSNLGAAPPTAPCGLHHL